MWLMVNFFPKIGKRVPAERAAGSGNLICIFSTHFEGTLQFFFLRFFFFPPKPANILAHLRARRRAASRLWRPRRTSGRSSRSCGVRGAPSSCSTSCKATRRLQLGFGGFWGLGEGGFSGKETKRTPKHNQRKPIGRVFFGITWCRWLAWLAWLAFRSPGGALGRGGGPRLCGGLRLLQRRGPAAVVRRGRPLARASSSREGRRGKWRLGGWG